VQRVGISNWQRKYSPLSIFLLPPCHFLTKVNTKRPLYLLFRIQSHWQLSTLRHFCRTNPLASFLSTSNTGIQPSAT
jgi:hypothetical protein